MKHWVGLLSFEKISVNLQSLFIFTEMKSTIGHPQIGSFTTFVGVFHEFQKGHSAGEVSFRDEFGELRSLAFRLIST